MKRKYMNTDNAQWKEPELTTLISEVGGGTNMQARVLQYNGNGLLFHMTQPISRSTIKAIACSKPTISEH